MVGNLRVSFTVTDESAKVSTKQVTQQRVSYAKRNVRASRDARS